MTNDNSIQYLKEFTNKIDGWLSNKEGEFLYKIAKECKGNGVIVEIGSWKGKSTIWLGKGSKNGENVKVYAIDPHKGSSEHIKTNGEKTWTFHEFIRNIKTAEIIDIVVPIVKTSEKSAKDWNKPIEVLFIDGAHEYEFVEKDFLLYFPHLIDGGIIAMHDTTSCIKPLITGSKGPKKVAEKYIFGSKKFKDIGVIDTITYARKCQNNTVKDRRRMKRIKLKKYFPDFIHLLFWSALRLPKPIKLMGERFVKFIGLGA